MVTTHRTPVAELRLTWLTNADKVRQYTLWSVDESHQIGWVADFEQGPFDTALDVAQWAWRAIAREVPPSSC
jgi:hypothetical protein